MHRSSLVAVAAACLLAVVALAASSSASGTGVTARVAPSSPLGGERIALSGRVSPARGSCTARIDRPGARATRLPRRSPVRGRVSWRWVVPVTAKGGPASARVTCTDAGRATARFTIRALPAGDPAAGKTVFLLNCGGCHTLQDAGTQGTSLDLDLLEPTFARTVDRVVNGKGLMPAFRSRFTPREIADVAAYVAAVAGR